MNEVILTLILLVSILILSCLTFVGGFFVGKKYKPIEKAEEKRPAPIELTEDEKLKKALTIAELKNFMSYTGDEQPGPETMLK